MNEFLDDPDILERSEKHDELITEMKMEALLATENSPYSEVRAVVDVEDDPTLPVLTFRVWVIGCIFSCAGSFIDSFFLMRNPPVYIGANVAQLLSCKSTLLFKLIIRSMWNFPSSRIARLEIQTLWNSTFTQSRQIQ
jgi:hypothetical protein